MVESDGATRGKWGGGGDGRKGDGTERRRDGGTEGRAGTRYEGPGLGEFIFVYGRGEGRWIGRA